jgi:hypothetical protein
MTSIRWRKSSHSGAGGDNSACVEVLGTLTALRDSKNATGPVLPGNVDALVHDIKTGQFER